MAAIGIDMNIIENQAYHQLCLFYKQDIDLAVLETYDAGGVMGVGLAYGLANWHAYRGDHERAEEQLSRIIEQSSWAAFGYIAAEADIARMSQ